MSSPYPGNDPFAPPPEQPRVPLEKQPAAPDQQPQYGQPQHGQQYAPPQYGQYGQPQYGQYGQPQYAPPQYGQPQYGQPQYAPPQYGQQYGQGYGYAPPAATPYGYVAPPGALLPGAVRPLQVGNRVLAYIIDALLLGVPGVIAYVLLLASVLGSTTESVSCDANGFCTSSGTTGNFGAGVGIVVVVLFLLVLAAAVWFVYLTGSRGQTPGKKWMGVKVVDAGTGQTIGFGRALGRIIVQGLCNVVCYAGLWSAFLDSSSGRYQGWHDKALNTQVISVK